MSSVATSVVHEPASENDNIGYPVIVALETIDFQTVHVSLS